jgi:hypothetical protein
MNDFPVPEPNTNMKGSFGYRRNGIILPGGPCIKETV